MLWLSALRIRLILIISICRQSGSSGGWRYEDVGCVLIRCIWQTCLYSCSAVIHIRCGVSIDVSTQQCQLLQRCASWHTDWHHPETAASLEQRSSDCAPGIEAILCHVIAAASSASDHIQVGSSDIQSLGHITPSYCTYMTESCYVSAAELCICQLSDCWSSR